MEIFLVQIFISYHIISYIIYHIFIQVWVFLAAVSCLAHGFMVIVGFELSLEIADINIDVLHIPSDSKPNVSFSETLA